MREICEACGEREASIQFTEVSRGSKKSIQICVHCAMERGVTLGGEELGQIGTEQIWAQVLQKFSQSREEGALACPQCGLTFQDFEASGQLGCPQCYQTFMGDMMRLLKEYHGDSRHQGKVPYDIGRRIDLKRRIQSIKESIQLAVGEERFEEAARLRDEMRDLETELGRLVEAGKRA